MYAYLRIAPACFLQDDEFIFYLHIYFYSVVFDKEVRITYGQILFLTP